MSLHYNASNCHLFHCSVNELANEKAIFFRQCDCHIWTISLPLLSRLDLFFFYRKFENKETCIEFSGPGNNLLSSKDKICTNKCVLKTNVSLRSTVSFGLSIPLTFNTSCKDDFVRPSAIFSPNSICFQRHQLFRK